jgi:hypothetical protein
MEQNAWALLYLLLLFGAWMLIPLLPAWITYQITPNQRLGLTGPFEQLTLRASGAFAAYLALLLISYKLVALGGLSIIGGMATPSVWTFKADIVAIDEKGSPVQIPDSVQALDVSFKPEIHQLGKSKILIRLPYNPENWPFMTVTIPNFGGAEIDLNTLSGVDLNYFKKTVELQGPIAVRQARGGGLGALPSTGFSAPQ